MKISCIIPAHNEEENITPLINKLMGVLSSINDNYEIIVVDDNSTDNTGEILDRLSNEFSNVEVIHRTKDQGVGNTLRCGFSEARGDVIVTMDADLSHDPADLKILFDTFNQGYDLVLGSRYIEKGCMDTATQRKIISRLFNMVAKLMTGVAIKDLTTGYRIHKKEMLEDLDLSSTGFEIHVEIPLKAFTKGYKIGECPILYQKRKRGKSKLKYLKEGPRYTKIVLSSSLNRFKTFLKFCSVGISGVFINMGILYMLTEFIGLYYMFSSALAIEISFISNFTLNDIWTWKGFGNPSTKSKLIRFLKFHSVYAGGLIINMSILYTLTEFVHIYYLISNLVGIGFATLWNYILSAKWIWKHGLKKD